MHAWSPMGVAPSLSEGVGEESTKFYLSTTWSVSHGEFGFCGKEFQFCSSEFELAV